MSIISIIEARQVQSLPNRLQGQATTSYWHSRGGPPHFQSHDKTQHVTFRLADSLPRKVLEQLLLNLNRCRPSARVDERRQRLETLVDAGYGSCLLRRPTAARQVQAALQYFDGERYHLVAWVVMPNHVHVLFHTLPPWTMAKSVASWKSFTGRRLAVIAREVGLDTQAMGLGRIWAREYWDRFIRDEIHFWNTLNYIHNNPVKARLVGAATDWEWSSARRWQTDERGLDW